MILIDTGFLIGLIDQRDQLNRRSIAWLDALIDQPLIVTSYVLLETLNHLSDPAIRPRAYAIIENLARTTQWQLLFIDETMHGDGTTLHRSRPDKHWSLTDCVSFIVMQQRGITRALAYDRHFEQAGFEPLLRRDPA